MLAMEYVPAAKESYQSTLSAVFLEKVIKLHCPCMHTMGRNRSKDECARARKVG